MDLLRAGKFAAGADGLLSRLLRDETGAIRFGRAPDYYGGQLLESQVKTAVERWLGLSYREISFGRFVSADGARVVRYGEHEMSATTHHIHFEATESGGVVENTWAEIVP